jgi:hypothetical protein
MRSGRFDASVFDGSARDQSSGSSERASNAMPVLGHTVRRLSGPRWRVALCPGNVEFVFGTVGSAVRPRLRRVTCARPGRRRPRASRPGGLHLHQSSCGEPVVTAGTVTAVGSRWAYWLAWGGGHRHAIHLHAFRCGTAAAGRPGFRMSCHWTPSRVPAPAPSARRPRRRSLRATGYPPIRAFPWPRRC